MAGLLKFSVRLSGARASATALLGSQNEAVARTISVASFHTGKKLDQGTWKVPERLADIPDAEDPNFFNMVEYYFHRACVLAEDRLMKVGVYFLSRTKVAIKSSHMAFASLQGHFFSIYRIWHECESVTRRNAKKFTEF